MVNSNLRDHLSGIAQIGSLDAKSKLDVTCIESITELLLIEKTNNNIIEVNPSPTYPHHAKLRTTYVAPTQESDVTQTVTLNLSLGDGPIFECGDVINILGVSGYNTDGTLANEELKLYVVSRNEDQIEVSAINGKKIGNITNCVPSISSGTTFIRLGRSGLKLAEDEMPIYEYYRVDSESKINYTLKFCVSLNESPEDHVLNGAITPNSKMSDLERDTLKAYMLSRDFSLLWGKESEDYYTTRGLVYQGTKTFNYDEDYFSYNLIEAIAAVLSSKKHSDVRYVIGGSTLVYYWMQTFNTNTLVTPVGTLVCVYLKAFDKTNQECNGIVIDPLYIKYVVKSPLTATYDLLEEILTISEESALVLTEPDTCMRIIMQ